MERSEGLRETVAIRLFATSQPGLSDADAYWNKERRNDEFKDLYYTLSDAALNAITASGFVIVRRDDLSSVLNGWDPLVDGWEDVYDRLRAALAPTDAGAKEDGE
jgi:hypothetical protein